MNRKQKKLTEWKQKSLNKYKTGTWVPVFLLSFSIILRLSKEKKGEIMIYLIDYENVSYSGLDGIEKIAPNDIIYLFYSKSANKISINVLEQIRTNNAEIVFIEAENGTKNSLDFQLCTVLGNIISLENRFIIISQDTGYDTTIRFWNKRGYNVVRQLSIKNPDLSSLKFRNKLPADLKKGSISKEIIRRNHACDKRKAGEIANILNRSQHIAVIKEKLIKLYGKKEAMQIFNDLSEIIIKINK